MTETDDWLVISPSGQVPCPRRPEIVALARCLECNWLLDLDRAGTAPSVRCAAADPAPDGRRAHMADAHVD